MERFGLRKYLYPALGCASWTAGVIAAVFPAAGKVDVKWLAKFAPNLVGPVSWLQSFSPIVTPSLILLLGLLAAFRSLIGEPWVYAAIHDFINVYRDMVFEKEQGEPLDEHRITIFRHLKWWHYPWRLPCKDWFHSRLAPMDRSGHLTQRTSTYFLVPDNAGKAEGVAGKAWRTFKTLIVSDLPEVTAQTPEKTIDEYARKTWCDVEWVRRRRDQGKPLARSMCAIPIRVRGQEWGVIIIDSKSTDAVKRTKTPTYDVMGRTLGKLLERV